MAASLIYFISIELAHARQWPAQRSFARPLFCKAAGCRSACVRPAQNASKIKPGWIPIGFEIDQILLPGSLLAPLGLLKASWSVLGSDLGPQFWHPFWAQAAQEPFPTSFFRLQRFPRALKEALQRLSEGLRVEDAFWS